MYWFRPFILIIGALLLPCPKCLATRQGLTEEKWREATMEASDLEEIPAKFRQHLWRLHGMRARDEEAQCMISFSKILLCPHLHERRPEVIISSYFLINISLCHLCFVSVMIAGYCSLAMFAFSLPSRLLGHICPVIVNAVHFLFFIRT